MLDTAKYAYHETCHSTGTMACSSPKPVHAMHINAKAHTLMPRMAPCIFSGLCYSQLCPLRHVHHPQAAATFAQFDTDSSGFLEPKELCHALRAIVPAITAEELRLVLAYLHGHDTNRDGSYSLQELQAAAAPFCIADAGELATQ